jgi:putative addiction module antidote
VKRRSGFPQLDKAKRDNDGYSMPIQTKVRKIGNSLGIVLPKEALQALKVGEGDNLFLTEAPESSLRVTAERPGFEEIMKIAGEGMSRYRNALRELAK